jgi:hypothetical protein
MKTTFTTVLMVVVATVCGLAFDAAAASDPPTAQHYVDVFDIFTLSPEQFASAINE